MGNICTVDMRLRTRKTNVAGLTKTLHYLMYSGGMMPSSKELQDFAVWIYQTKKSLSLKETKKSFDFKSKGIYVKPEKLDK